MELKPNIVIFNPDEMRADTLHHLGNPASSTPNLDQFAMQDAVSFKNAYCQNPVCTPSRCSFMSGWYPHVRGHRIMQHMMHVDEPVLLKTLKDNGYYIWWGGKNDLIPGNQSFEPYCDYHLGVEKPMWGGKLVDKSWRGNKKGDTYYSFYAGEIQMPDDDPYCDFDWYVIQNAIDFIQKYDGEKPYCIFLPLIYPHPPYTVEKPWFGQTNRKLLPSRVPEPKSEDQKSPLLYRLCDEFGMKDWDEEQWDELRGTYLDMCSRVDYQFGLIVEALKVKNMYDSTALFFFSDHGDFTGDFGLVEKSQNTFEDCLTRVPFIVKPPAGWKVQPGISDALVELIDFPATVEDFTGVTPDYTHFGKSLAKVIAGETTEHSSAVFCEGGRLPNENHCVEILQPPEDHLYYPRMKLQAQENNMNYKAVMIRTTEFKYILRLEGEDELYDLRIDPYDQKNVIGQKQYQTILPLLRDRVLKFFMETADVVPHVLDPR